VGWVSGGIGLSHSWHPVLLRLRCKTAATLIHPLAWELPYATGAVLKRKKKKKERDRESKRHSNKKFLRNHSAYFSFIENCDYEKSSIFFKVTKL